jgi:hypothetical protein
MKRRRPRPLGRPAPKERARKVVDTSINRAKEDIAAIMPLCGAYLKDKVVFVAREAKWMYTGMRWRVEGL